VVIESLDGAEFSIEGLFGLRRLESRVLVLEVVELDISRVNEGGLVTLGSTDHGSSGGVVVGFEVTDDFLSDVQITELLNVGLSGEVLDDFELLLKGFNAGVNGFEVFQEVNGVQITQARSNALSQDSVLRSAVSGPRAFFTIGSSGGIDVDIGREEVFEHGARFTGFDVENHLLVHLVVVHKVQGLDEVIGIKVIRVARESNETSGTVISKVDKDVVFSGTLEDFLATSSLGISLKDGQEVLGGDILSLIVDLDTSIDVLTGLQEGRLVVDFTGPWVFRVVGDIVISHSDDVFSRISVFDQDLIGMEDIRLMSVVVVVVGTGNEDGVVSSLSAKDGKAEDSKS
jgi:hypothetical protein